MKIPKFCQTSLGGRFVCLLLAVFCLSSSAQTESLSSLTEMEHRVSQLAPKVEDLFHEARDDFDRLALKAGQSRFAKRYAHKKKASSYKGYVLKGDPYDPKEKRISFLKGSDCSHFIHRFFQLMGADYSYTKTRHFMEWVEKGTIKAWSECRNMEFAENFRVLTDITMENLKLGDLLVWPRSQSHRSRAFHGHVVIVTSVSPLMVLHAKNHRMGIVQEVLEPADFKGAKVLRWVGKLSYGETLPIETLLTKKWPRDPSRCAR